MKKNYFLALAVFSLMSCQQEELTSKGMYSDDFMSKLKFKTIITEEPNKTRGVPEDGPSQSQNDEVREEPQNDISIIIFSVRIARPSTGCKKGFGFCDFKWFPMVKEFKAEQASRSDMYENSFTVQVDAQGNKFVDVELAESSSTLDTKKLQPLVVEEQLESYATVNNKEELMVVPKGTYQFNSSIGKFGGYRVPIK